jgi:hypothetical protein
MPVVPLDFSGPFTEFGSMPNLSLTAATQVHTEDSTCNHESLELDRVTSYHLQPGVAGITAHRTSSPRETYLQLGAGKPFPPQLPDSGDYVVEFDGLEDPAHPYNWNLTVKFRTSLRFPSLNSERNKSEPY